MKKILLTGGQSSGKSSKALEIADIYEKKYFIATARYVDGETSEKIRLHVEERKNRYTTMEEPLRVCSAVREALGMKPDVIVLDCVTMWISNLLFELGDEGMDIETGKLLEFLSGEQCRNSEAILVIVTNEVGSGIIPMNELSRKYCAVLGRVNKKIAAVCDEVYLMACGLGLKLK